MGRGGGGASQEEVKNYSDRFWVIASHGKTSQDHRRLDQNVSKVHQKILK